MAQIYLIGYSHPRGFGRTFNYRYDNKPPSIADIESIESKLAVNVGSATIISVTRLADGEIEHKETNL